MSYTLNLIFALCAFVLFPFLPTPGPSSTLVMLCWKQFWKCLLLYLEYLGGSRPGMSTQLEFYAYSLNLDVLLVLDTRAVVMERQLCVSICCFIAVPPFVNQGVLLLLWKSTSNSIRILVVTVNARYIHCKVLNFMKSVEQFATFLYMYPHKKKKSICSYGIKF